MAYSIEKKKAIKMRKNGMSIRDISRSLEMNKTTVSYWCRDIEMSDKQKLELVLKQKKASIKALLRCADARRKKRIKDTKELKEFGRKMLGAITKRDLFCIGLGLYCGEGYKNINGEVGFTNSDERIIQFIMRWFEEIYGIKKSDFVFRISINVSHKKREKEILDFWTCTLGVLNSQFTKTSFINTQKKKLYTGEKRYYGTLRVKVRKSTSLKRKIMGSIDGILHP